MVDDFRLVGAWLLDAFKALWEGFGALGFIGFAVIFFPVMKKLIRLFKSLVNS